MLAQFNLNDCFNDGLAFASTPEYETHASSTGTIDIDCDIRCSAANGRKKVLCSHQDRRHPLIGGLSECWG